MLRIMKVRLQKRPKAEYFYAPYYNSTLKNGQQKNILLSEFLL